MAGKIQRAFAGGEITPATYGRVDMTKYQTGLRTCRNWLVLRHGGLANRPGTKFITEVKTSATATRAIEWIFNDSQTYVLELGDRYIRFIDDATEAYVKASGVAAWATATVYEIADLRFVGTVVYYCKGAHTSAAASQPGVGATWALYWYAQTSFTTSPLVSIYEIPSPYIEAELFEVTFKQSNSVVFFAHDAHPPFTLSRIAATEWTMVATVFRPGMAAPTGLVATEGSGTGTRTLRYKVTAAKKTTLEESLAGREAGAGNTAGTPFFGGALDINMSIFDVAHGLTTGDEVVTSNPLFSSTTLSAADREYMRELLEGNTFRVIRVDADNFELDGISSLLPSGDTNNYTTNFITWHACQVTIPTAALNPVTPHLIEWTAVDGAVEYYIYKDQNESGTYGFTGTSTKPQFEDFGVEPDYAETPPVPDYPFRVSTAWPSCVALHQQRLAYGGSSAEPQSVKMSRTGSYKNFTLRSPLQDDDSIRFAIAGERVNEVRNLLALKQLVIFTRGAEWVPLGDSGSGGEIRPDAINLEPQGHHGIGALPPLIVGETAVYVQARGSVVRDLRFQVETGGYTGRELSIFASHLFDGLTFVDLAYQEAQHSIAWFVRGDGVLLGLTYIPEQDIWGWHRHDTDGLFKSVAVIPNGVNDVPYFVVQRTINGVSKRYIEKMMPRKAGDPNYAATTDAWFLDCAIRYSGAAATAMTGLSHLEAKVVYALADGVVRGPFTVASGAITLPVAASVVTIGLLIANADVETLDIDSADSGDLLGKRKLVNRMELIINNTRGLKVGVSSGNLFDLPRPNFQDGVATTSTTLLRGKVAAFSAASWSTAGRVYIRQVEPLPAEIAAIIPYFTVGGEAVS